VTALPSLAAIVAHATALRRDLHRHPELGWREERTAAIVRGELDRLGLAWRACAGTGTIATLAAGRSGRHLAIRADLDALPITETSGVAWASIHAGCMHACGHDGHTAGLLAAAAWLKAQEAALSGPVSLLFQPAEEIGEGARRMVAGGALAGVDALYGYHNWPPVPLGQAVCAAGPVMAANGVWRATITGRGAHASQPQDGIDPVATAAAFITLAQQIVSRRTSPNTAAVVAVSTIHAGSVHNAMPDSAELSGIVRAATSPERDWLGVQLDATLAAACAVSGASYRFVCVGEDPAVVNDAACAGHAARALDLALGLGWAHPTVLPLMAAEDFAWYLDHVPGCFVLLGGGAPDGSAPCHSPRYDFNDGLIAVVARFVAALVGAPLPH